MSYEYGRIPLKPGLNIVCGPNGSGKSSILLAISVALGQIYTERSRRLSDLIRRGKDTARVTLLFDNRPREGRRPISVCRSDTFMLSRYLKLDGSYWYEADYREISKSEVIRLFHHLGINPDNLMIIMHQGMVEEFSIISPQDKLKMVEEAVGFGEYRQRILEAQEKLTGLISEETSLSQILDSTVQTVDYWKSVYNRFLIKKNLTDRRYFLDKELTWANVIKNEKALKALNDKLNGKTKVLNDTLKEIEETSVMREKTHANLMGKQTEVRKLYFSLMRLEKEKTKTEVKEETLQPIKSILQKGLDSSADQQLDTFRYYIDKFALEIEDCLRRRRDLEIEVKALQENIGGTEGEVGEILEKYVNLRISEAVLAFQKKNLERDISEIRRNIKELENQIGLLAPEKAGPRIETERSPSEVAEEARIVISHLQTFADVPDDAEKIYLNFASSYNDLKEKLEIISENKKATLKEVEERKTIWSKALQMLLSDTNPLYQEILSHMSATGFVRLVDTEDIESSGLELLVGFRGANPTVLDAYTQSGGERSVAVIAFLLSLQGKVVSPFRAVDEFDVHMDPRNREAVFKMIFSYFKSRPSTQHVIITPSELTVLDDNVNLIFVQNTQGRSRIREVKVSEAK